MWSGVEPDVALFASGRVASEEDEWAGAIPAGGDAAAAPAAPAGGSGAGGSGSAPAAPAGMPLCLSQIQEWVLEAAADALFINIRTDVAWYRLKAPAAAYAPW